MTILLKADFWPVMQNCRVFRSGLAHLLLRGTSTSGNLEIVSGPTLEVRVVPDFDGEASMNKIGAQFLSVLSFPRGRQYWYSDSVHRKSISRCYSLYR
jgi:hypothetical protein